MPREKRVLLNSCHRAHGHLWVVETKEELLYLLVFVWSRGSEVELRYDLKKKTGCKQEANSTLKCVYVWTSWI